MAQARQPDPFFLKHGYVVYGDDFNAAVSGNNGKVFPAIRMSTGDKVGIKLVEKFTTNAYGQKSAVDEKFINKEADILNKLTIPRNINEDSHCKLLGSLCLLEMFDTYDAFYFVMPWIDGPSLSQWITTIRKTLPTNIANTHGNHRWVKAFKKGNITKYGLNKGVLYLMLELSKTLQKLHNQNIAHSDLKPDNIHVSHKSCLLQLKNLKDEIDPNTFECHLVILDFGLSCLFNAVELHEQCLGTTPIMNAPESWGMSPIDFHKNVKHQDVYSLGLILAWMGMGEHPYDDVKETDDNKLLEKLIRNSQKAKNFINTGIKELDYIIKTYAVCQDREQRNLDELVHNLEFLYMHYNVSSTTNGEMLQLFSPLMKEVDEYR